MKARNGQGVFRGRVLLTEPSCRATGVTAPEHLRVRHIKPWRRSTDAARLDRNNGLMLSPHIDHLFDDGYITFESNGTMIIASKLAKDVAERWKLRQSQPPRPFSEQQKHYLEYHRSKIFRG